MVSELIAARELGDLAAARAAAARGPLRGE